MTTHCECYPKQGLRPQDKKEASVEGGSQWWLSEAVCLWGVGNHRYGRMALGIWRGTEGSGSRPQGPQEKSQLYPGGLCPLVIVQLPPMVKPWRMNGFCLAFLRCILIQVLLPEWVRCRKVSNFTPAGTFPSLPLDYITWHIFRNLVLAAETSVLKFQLLSPHTLKFPRKEMLVFFKL